MPRRLHNLPRPRQAELRQQFPWLLALRDHNPLPPSVCSLALSVFDHWLSEDEARRQLAHVPPAEQARRDACHAQFAQALAAQTELLSCAWRGRNKGRPVFRRFTSTELAARYCAPHGGRLLGHRAFQVVLPHWQATFLQGWDDTHHLFSTDPTTPARVAALAARCGLHLLPPG